MDTHIYILTIAGLDPSSGAGLTSDIKTFQAHGLYGLSVCTTVTVQNDVDFTNSHWVDIEAILQQIEILFERFKIEVVKIGIVQNWQTLAIILERLEALYPNIKVILDPVLKATAGYDFHFQDDLNALDSILDKVYLITPNYEEIQSLYPEKSIEDTIEHISNKTNLYLKGGHRTNKKGWDELYHSGIVQVNIEFGVEKVSDKHGSGCVLSSALAANIALDIALEEAAKNAKYYTEQYLNSHQSLLGNHKSIMRSNN